MRTGMLMAACVVVLSCCLQQCQAVTITGTDLNAYFVDGDMLTRNWDVRYLNAVPVSISVTGRSTAEAQTLVDGNRNGPAGLTWTSGNSANVVIDLGQVDMVSAVSMMVTGGATWDVYTSGDGLNWRIVPSTLKLTGPGTMMVPNLARLARYVRINAVAWTAGFGISEIFIYGEKTNRPAVIGGVYTSVYPPVAGTQVTLRAVIRNSEPRPMINTRVEFFRKNGSDLQKLGDGLINVLNSGSAAVVAIPWTPGDCEPTNIVVKAGKKQMQQTFPVVNRRLYFGSFVPADYGRHSSLLNLYLASADIHDYWQIKLRGGISLTDVPGTGGAYGNLTQQQYYDMWNTPLHGTFTDGIAIDEFGYPNANGFAALATVCAGKGDKIVFGWSATTITQEDYVPFSGMDFVALEIYCSWLRSASFWDGHNNYRAYIRRGVDPARAGNLTDHCLIALSYFMSSRPTIPDELEREVRYCRLYAPEMPGIIYYGSTWRDDEGPLWDNLSYKYFVNPVVHAKNVNVQGTTATVDVENMGGMNAHDVVVQAYSSVDNQLIASQTAPLITPGQTVTLTFGLGSAAAGSVNIRLAQSDGYTVL